MSFLSTGSVCAAHASGGEFAFKFCRLASGWRWECGFSSRYIAWQGALHGVTTTSMCVCPPKLNQIFQYNLLLSGRELVANREIFFAAGLTGKDKLDTKRHDTWWTIAIIFFITYFVVLVRASDALKYRYPGVYCKLHRVLPWHTIRSLKMINAFLDAVTVSIHVLNACMYKI